MVQLVKNPPVMRVDLGSIPGLGRSSRGGKDYPLQYSGLENSESDRTKGLSLFTFLVILQWNIYGDSL